MTVTLHLARVGGRTCLVCGASMRRKDDNAWWARHTWTTSRWYYRSEVTPHERYITCGRLPEEKK